MPSPLRALAVAALLASAVSGASTPLFSAADVTPPTLSIVHPDPAFPYRAGGSSLPLLFVHAHDNVGVDSVVWSTGAGEQGAASLVCPSEASQTDCLWEARQIPLNAGPDTLTVTVHDAAGNTAMRQLDVTARGAVTTFYVDCSGLSSGDGTIGSPFNDLQTAIFESASGDTIQIIQGHCAADVVIEHGLTIQGDPSLPRADMDTRGWYLDIRTPEPVTLRHLRMMAFPLAGNNSVRPNTYLAPAEILLEDVQDFSLLAASPRPSYVVRHSENVEFFGYPSGAGIQVDAETSTGLAVAGYCYSGGVVTLRIRDSQIAQFWICDHGYYDILIERSIIRAGGSVIQQAREGGCCALDLTIRDSSIEDTRLSIQRETFYSIHNPYAVPRASLAFERNIFTNSSVELRVQNMGALPAPLVADLVFQNNIMDRSMIRVSLSQSETPSESVFAALIRHNTFFGAPTAIEIQSSLADSTLPNWQGEIANNIITGSGTGVRVSGDAPGLFSTRITGNDFYRNLSNLVVDQPASLEGNIFLDPRFQHASRGDFSLKPNSPCIDAGLDITAPPGDDLAGSLRPIDGNKDGIARPDIGALEFVPRRMLHRVAPTPSEP